MSVRRRLCRAGCLHSLTVQEADSARQCGVTSPVAVVPNGVDTEPFDSLPSETEVEKHWKQLTGRRVVLFLGRIHPKKGLEHLLRAWAHLPESLKDWRLVIAGPDEVGTRGRLEAMTVSLGAADRVTWVGPVYGREKQALWSKADAFVLPSFSEGLSCAMMEAAAAGLPVVATPQTILDGLVEADGGLAAPPEEAAWTATLTSLLGLSDDQRRAMGRRARELINQRYTWPRVAEQMAAVYGWLLNQRDRPECVHAA